MAKSRIPEKEYNYIINVATPIIAARAHSFKEFFDKFPKPDRNSSSPDELQKLVDIFNGIQNSEYDIRDLMYYANGFLVKSQDDTHVKGRAVEKALGGRCDGKPDSDFIFAELKLIQTIRTCDNLEQVLTIGAIAPGKVIVENFEESCTYKKLKSMFVATYLREGKQLGHKINSHFVFNVKDPKFFNKIKEDYEFYVKEWKKAREEELAGTKIKKASGIMKSDNGLRCPNHTLGIRSDGIIFTKKFFKEVSNYYVK